MTDLEMLELAALAAGYKKYYAHHLGRASFVTYDVEYYSEVKGRCVVAEKTLDWNPRDDDGDALRLACDLGLRIFPVARTESGAACSAVGAVTGERLSEVVATLPTRATARRAILLAAAAIGQAKK